jgi:hypothetical protein
VIPARGPCWPPALPPAGSDLVEVFLESTDHIGLLAEQDTITNVSPLAFGRGLA